MVGRSHQATSTARTTRWLVAALALCACASTGCAAYRATQQPDKKNLSVLSRGTPRSRVIAELGAPVNTDHEDGKTVDPAYTANQYSATPYPGGPSNGAAAPGAYTR